MWVPWTEAVIGPRAAAEIVKHGAIRFVRRTVHRDGQSGIVIERVIHTNWSWPSFGWLEMVWGKMSIYNSTNGSNEISEISAAPRGPANRLPVHGTHFGLRIIL